ncbi:MAG TPA: DUF1611 domain-containing protein [Ktedonobacterales bacterium]|nr:DUF1611 domain-containing protein [Ktedonobacterales bacterium]
MRHLAILAEGNFDWHTAKTAVGVIRYGTDSVVAVIDSTHAGQDAGAVLRDPAGPARGIPVVANVAAALAYHPDTLLIGIAPRGGRLPDEWRPGVLLAIESGLDIISGLHHFLGEDTGLAEAARRCGVTIWDVRQPPAATAMRIATGQPHRAGSHVVYFAGTDCNVGKMTAAFEVDRAARQRGLSSAFAATGQTGIMIAGRGIPADRYISDFLAGGTEALVQELADRYDWVFVEGQGALSHPAYSAVTLGLVHGAAPDYLLLCHHAGRQTISGYPTVPLPSLSQARAMYETAASWLKPAPTVGVVLNTFELPEDEARAALAAAEREIGLPAADPVRFGAGPLVDALLAAVEAHAR